MLHALHLGLSYDEALTIPFRVLVVLLQAERDEKEERLRAIRRACEGGRGKGTLRVLDIGGLF